MNVKDRFEKEVCSKCEAKDICEKERRTMSDCAILKMYFKVEYILETVT